MNKNKPYSIAGLFLSVATLLAIPQPGARAANQTWTGNTDGSFSNGSNWAGGAAPGLANNSGASSSGNIATFGDSANTAITMDQGRTLSSLVFAAGAGAYTFGGGDVWLTVNAQGVTVAQGVTNSQSFNINLHSTAATLSLVNDGSGDLSFTGSILNDRTGTVAMTLALGGNGGGTNSITGVISDGTSSPTNLTKSGASHWVLGAANTYTGATSLLNGTLELDFSAAAAPVNNLISTSSQLKLGSVANSAVSGTLQLTGKANTANSQTFNGFAVASGAYHITLAPSGSGSMTVNLGAMSSTARISGFALDLSLPANTSAFTSTGNVATAGVLPNNVTINGTDFAAVNGSGQIVAFTDYTANTASAITGSKTLNSITDMAGVNTTLTASAFATQVYAIRFNENASRSLTLNAGQNLAVTNGILVTSNVGGNAAKIVGDGVLTGALNRDVAVLQNNTNRAFEIGTVIGDRTQSSPIGLTKAGAGELLLSRANTYSGTSLLHEGTTTVTGDAVAQSSKTATTTASSAVLTGIDTTGLFVGQQVTGGALAGTYYYISAIDAAANTVTLNTAASITAGTGSITFLAAGGLGRMTGDGAVKIATGATLQIGNGGSTGSLLAGQNLQNDGKLVFNRSDSGQLFSNNISGLGDVWQSGSGVTTLSGANNYTGKTVVSAGTLIINGDQSAATGALTVAAGATLGGSGTIGGSAVISGIHNPGNSPGVMTFLNNLSYNSGALVNWELDGNTLGVRGTDFDGINVGGNLSTDSSLLNLVFNSGGSTVDWSDSFWQENHSWLFYRVDGDILGAFALGDVSADSLDQTLVDGFFSINYVGSDVFIDYTAVPEPSTFALVGFGLIAGSLLRRKRRPAPVSSRSRRRGRRFAALGMTALLPLGVHGGEPAKKFKIEYPAKKGTPSIVFQFDKEYPCGQYANGDWWVQVDPETKSVEIKAISPDDGEGRNGWCSNPANHGKQPFDDRAALPFDASLMPGLPYTAHAGESIVKAVSAEKKVHHSFVQNAAVLTVLAAPPKYGADSFRPPYSGNDKPEFSAKDLHFELLPNLEPVQGAITRAIAESRVRLPRLDYSSSWESSGIRPIDACMSWGTDMSRDDSEVLLWLCLKAPVEEKWTALIGLVQYGIDLYGARKELGTDWFHDPGGNGNGRLLPFVLAATLLDNPEIKQVLSAAVTEDEKKSPFWEILNFRRSPKAGRVLWGSSPPYANTERYWKALAVDPKNDKAGADPYGWIDGAAIPGGQYQGAVSLPVKYTALILRLIPQLQANWPQKEISILEYADRWAEHGAYTLPDPVAPAPKLTEEEWIHRAEHGYGKTWGPDPAHPGEAIKGAGRFPALDGTHKNAFDLPAGRKSAFGEAMWNQYRGKITGF